MTKYKDIKEVNFNNITDTGTEGTKVASGTTGQRGSTAGQFRFNTTTNLAEYYTGTEFKPIDAPPVITGVSSSELNSVDITGGTTLTINGASFSSVTVKIIDQAATETSCTVNSQSGTQIVIAVPTTLTYAQEPFDVKVENNSGLSATLEDAFTVNEAPVITTSAGSLGTLADSNRASSALSTSTIVATDDENDTLTFAVSSGSLPSGLTLNSSSGAITGTANPVSTNTTSNFSITASDSAHTSSAVAYSITVQAPVITFNTASGSIGTIADNQRSSYSLSPVTATVTSGTLSYSVVSGSLSSGLSLNSSTGAITGTANAVSSDTTSNFTIRATTTSASVTADRAFSITVQAPAFLSASGGNTISTSGDYKYHIFTSSGTFTVSSLGADSTYGNKIDYLLVAGGGGGGRHIGGAGGAGGMRSTSSQAVTVSAQGYTITVGGGGGGDTSSSNGSGGRGSQGGSSSAFSLTNTGGGGGGSDYSTGGSGGSGGGCGHGNGTSNNTSATGGGANVSGQGNRGGGGSQAGGHGGGGGGGKNGVGGNGGNAVSGNGGAGLQWSGGGLDNNYYAGGGGGGGYTGSAANGGIGGGGGGSSEHASGGSGGGSARNSGGNGSQGGGQRGGHAGSQTGSGGGGGAHGNGNGGNGGSGIVIVKYKFQ